MAEFLPLKGSLLLDAGNLDGSFFHRTVVLVCQHDGEGAFGLVLNKPSGCNVGETINTKLPAALRQQVLFLGGPVQPGGLSFLCLNSVASASNILPDLSLSHSLDFLIRLEEGLPNLSCVKIFAGYAGWSPGQLEDELQRKAWLVHPADSKLVFQDCTNLWKTILMKKGPEHRLLAQSPDDLSWN